jgi:hypothetical protein
MRASSYNLFVPDVDAVYTAGSTEVPGELVARLLAPDDWNFISRQTSPTVQQMFYRERKTISVSWMRQLRSQVAQLMKFHRQSVRPNVRLNLATELKLMGHAWVFYVVYAAALLVNRVWGPAQAAGLMANLAATAERLCSISEARLAEIEPAHLDRLRMDRIPPATAGEWPPARRAQDLVRNMEVEAAIAEIKKRELGGLRSEFSGLTYLASTRDYNSARYYHEGLARRFTEDVMEQALAACHTEVFRRLACRSVEEIVRQLDVYVRATPEPPANVLRAWTELEPFRVLRPLGCDQLLADLFVSNVKVVLCILQNNALVAEPAYDIADLPIKP